jgi:hypothetical protein
MLSKLKKVQYVMDNYNNGVRSKFDVPEIIFVRSKKMSLKSMHKLLSILIFSFTLISFYINFFLQIK